MASTQVSSDTPALSRRVRKKEWTRREIYQAAMRLFARRGFEASTIADICEEADVGRGTFFLHFATKSALLYEFNQQFAEDFRTELEEPRGTAASELRAFVTRMAQELSSRAEIMSAMIADFYASPENLTIAPDDAGAIVEMVTEIIRRGQKLGEFSSRIDARLAAGSLFATAGAIVSGYVHQRSQLPPEEINSQLLQLTLTGLSPAGDVD